MTQTSGEQTLFDWLEREHLEELVARLNALPSGSEFERRTASALEKTIGVDDAEHTYEEIRDVHGDLVGVVEGEDDLLPWWLRDFDWTVSSDHLSSLTLDEGNLDEFEQYPRESTFVETIELAGAEPFTAALDAFVALEGRLNEALQLDPTALAEVHDVDVDEYTLPEKIFTIPESGRVATTKPFERWFGRVVNLCPPANPSLTALLRANVNIERKYVTDAVTADDLDRLEALGILDSADEDERAFDEGYYDRLVDLLSIEAPFDLEIDIEHEKDELTDLQYLYYREWARVTERRLPEGQRWLRAAKDLEELAEAERFRFAHYAFRMPLRLANDAVTFTHQSRYGRNSSARRQILELLAEHGHLADDD